MKIENILIRLDIFQLSSFREEISNLARAALDLS